jgi:riboflavin synthase
VFTGLIVEMGEVQSVRKRSGGALLQLKADEIAAGAELGDSVSVNGVCLTVVKNEHGALSFDLSDETLKSTNLGNLVSGNRVNLEPSLRPDSKIGGHFVTGHVDAIGTIHSRVKAGDMWKFAFKVPPSVTQYLVEKGSVAVDGISLTVVDILDDGFTVVIIPHTAQLTTLGFKGNGESVNVEADLLGKYVVKFLKKGAGREGGDAMFMRTLIEGGYVDRERRI